MAMVDFLDIYRHQGTNYQRMIEAEDWLGNLAKAFSGLLPLERKLTLLDLGSGTGRIPRLLRNKVDQIVALDLHREMLKQQQPNTQIIQADMRRLPFPAHHFDVSSAGWAIGHLCGWYPECWHMQVRGVLEEMHRSVKPGGKLIIMETLSTGALQPAPPTPALAELYAWFEDVWGFEHQTITTDYLFSSPKEAKACLGFFFGEDLIQKIDHYQWSQVPEWTSIWWKTIL
jgi:ubiquinone/menaquinone biosynthesis C-methylase UbiE